MPVGSPWPSRTVQESALKELESDFAFGLGGHPVADLDLIDLQIGHGLTNVVDEDLAAAIRDLVEKWFDPELDLLSGTKSVHAGHSPWQCAHRRPAR